MIDSVLCSKVRNNLEGNETIFSNCNLKWGVFTAELMLIHTWHFLLHGTWTRFILSRLRSIVGGMRPPMGAPMPMMPGPPHMMRPPRPMMMPVRPGMAWPHRYTSRVDLWCLLKLFCFIFLQEHTRSSKRLIWIRIRYLLITRILRFVMMPFLHNCSFTGIYCCSAFWHDLENPSSHHFCFLFFKYIIGFSLDWNVLFTFILLKQQVD